MVKGYFRNKFSSFIEGFRNEGSSSNANEIELEEGKNVNSDNGDNDEPKNNSKNRISITQNVTNVDEAFEAIKLEENIHSIHFIINKSFKRLESENFEKLTEIIRDNQITAFQNEPDGTFYIVWKKTKDEIYAVNISERNNIDKEDLMSLCRYILKFLNECLQNNHSGLSSGNEIPADNFNIDLPSLTDTDGLNLLFHAASNGNTQIIPILLQVAFNVNMVHSIYFAGDLAFKNNHYETVLKLLKHNAYFPAGFNAENCPNDELKAFVQMTKEIHEHIMVSNLEEIRKILTENPKLRYFHNIRNQSASAVALKNKKFEVYELLLQNNIFLSVWENIDDQTRNLSDKQKKKIREIHFNNKKDVHESHLAILLQKSSVGHDDENVQERLNHVMRAFQELNKFPMIQILLKIAALMPNLQIIFDFNRNSVEYLDPTQDRSTFGLFYLNGRVYVGALQLLNPLRQHEVYATIAHELCHFVLFKIFGNMAKPYKDGDEKTETEFQAISIICQRRKKNDEIIKAVYDYYPPERFHAELIVRIPHFCAHYYNKPKRLERLKFIFKSLFDFYELNLMPKLEENLKKFQKKAKNKQNVRDKKIIIISSIIGLIAMVCVGIWFYEPTYQWSELENEQKMKVFDGKVRFEGVEAKFKEIYGTNDTTNENFNKLTSDQIKILLNDRILDLNEDQNEFLQKGIFLTYQNLTENLREKVKNGSVNFQGQLVDINSLLGVKTEKILQTFNSTQIFNLIKGKKLIKTGQEMETSSDFHIHRKLIDKHDKNSSEVSSSGLIDIVDSKKVILLSDDAGNGKTTTFKYLTREWKQKFPQKWVQYVDLKLKIKTFDKYQNKNSNLKEILTKIFDLNGLNLEVFEMLFDNQKIVILWDGFDEISPTYSDFMLKLMKNLKNETQNIQFVSTRPHYEKDINDFLDCQVLRLKPLNKADNEDFLNDFYNRNKLTTTQIKKAEEKVEILIEKVQEHTYNYAPKDYVESPLLLKMIAEVSLNDDEKFDFTNLYTIYDSFINTKIKLLEDQGDVAKYEEIKIKRKGLHLDEIFQYFAVKSFLYDLEIVHRYENQTLNLNLLSRYGILIFDSNGIHQFVHRTFQEFFLTQYLVENFYDFDDETNCNEINERFKVIFDYTIYKDNPKVEEFFLGYFDKFKTAKVSQNLIFCFKNHSKLNNLFNEVFYKDETNEFGPTIDRVIKLLKIIPFTSESLEILWHFDRNQTFFSDIAVKEPKIFVDSFNKIQEILTQYFPNNQEKQKKLFFGKNQRGSYLYAIYKDTDYKDFNVENYLHLLNISLDVDIKKFKFSSTFEFYQFLKSHLTADETREMLKSHFSYNLIDVDGFKFWNEIESKFTRKEMQELIYESKFWNRQLLYLLDFTLIKLIFETLDGTSDSRFYEFIQYDNRLLLDKERIMLDDNFEIFWNVIENRTTKDDRKKILELELLSFKRAFRFNIFSASIDFGTIKKFELVKKIYEENLNSTEKMREFCENYFKIEREEDDPWHPEVETAEAFVEYLKSLFTLGEIKSKFENSLEDLYGFYSERENLDFSYPLFNLLFELITVNTFDNNQSSEEISNELVNNVIENKLLKFFVLPAHIDRNVLKNFSTFFDVYDLIKSHLNDEEFREFLKVNFIQIIRFGGIKMWNEVESKFTREELQELIYESKFEYNPLVAFVTDYNLLKLIFKTLDGTPGARFLKFIQLGHLSLLIYKERIMLDDNFEFFWNLVENRTTKDERKTILKLELHNLQKPHGFNIFSASIEFGTVEIFGLVKKIYENHFNSTEKMREFCENYFEIEREPNWPWHPKVETAEAFVKYLKSLFTIDEIESKLDESIENFYMLYKKRENLDDSYPFFSLRKELNNNKLSKKNIKKSKNHLRGEKLLKYFVLPTKIEPNEFKNFETFSEFYDLIKSKLTDDEIREFFKINFIKILEFRGLEMWNEIESKFTKEELQELIYESKLKDKSLLWFVYNSTLLKNIFKALDGNLDSRFLNFIQHGNETLLLGKELLMLDDNFEFFWNATKNLTTEEERRKILELYLLNTRRPHRFNIFSASIELGTSEKFELAKNIYEENFNSTEKMREFCENYFKIKRQEDDPWQLEVETAEAFAEYLKSLFTIDEMNFHFEKSLIELYDFYSERENLDDSFPFFSLLIEFDKSKEIENDQFLEEFKNKSEEYFSRNKFLKNFDLPANMDSNDLPSFSTFSFFYELIKSNLTDDEVRDYLKLNFIKNVQFGAFEMWNEIESKFTREELQELIYKSKFQGLSLLRYINDFTIYKLIFKTLDGTPDSRFLNFIQYDKSYLLIDKELLMLDDNFEAFWNVIENRTTKEERKNILKLTLINEQKPYGFYIFDASIEFGTVEKFEFVKNIYEKHFNSTEKMREFCENYFRIEREEDDPWQPEVETAEAYVNYLKSLFTIDEIKSKFKEPLEELYEFYSEEENLDDLYPFFSLLKEF